MKMNLVLASDDHGSTMLAVVAFSIAKNNPKHSLHFYIFHSDISKGNIRRIKLLQSKFKNITLSFIEVNQDTFKGIDVTNENVSTPAYYRYLAPEKISAEEDKVLCLDFDMLCIGDLAELYSTNLKGNLIGAVADYVVENDPFYDDFKTGIGLGLDTTYVNSGLLVMDLKAIRDSNAMMQFWENVRSKSKLIPAKYNVFADQTVTNLTFKGKIQLLDEKYNVFTTALKDLRLKDPRIVHFTGSYKPLTYRDELTSIYDDIYYQYYSECMEIIGDDGGRFIKNTLKKLSKEQKDITSQLQASERQRTLQDQKIQKANEYTATLKKQLEELQVLRIEEHKTKNLLRNLLLNLDKRITIILRGNRQGAEESRSSLGVFFGIYKVLSRLVLRGLRRVYKAILSLT